MKEFKIFIASSNDEYEERNALKEFLLIVSRVTRNYGIEFLPIMWEMESVDFVSGLSEKQDEYNKKLISSDMVFFLFGKRVGKYTYDEFIVACSQVKENRAIKVYVYFKEIDIGKSNSIDEKDLSDLNKVVELRKYIANELHQVYGKFASLYELIRNFTVDVLSAILPKLNGTLSLNTKIQDLMEHYDKITTPFLADKRDDIIADAINSLYFLYRYNVAPDELNSKNFYELLHLIISKTPAGGDINALSLMLKSEWDDSKDEQSFWQDNQEAVKRRVNLERIFIVNRNEAHRLKTIPQIKNHILLEEKYRYIHSYVVEKERLQQDNPSLLDQARNGFIMIKSPVDKIVLFDTPESEKRAIPVLDDQTIYDITMTFNAIKQNAIPLKNYLENITWSHYKKEMISIFVTTKCNLNCDYCFTNKNQNEHKGQTISLDFVKKGIDDYFKEKYMRHVRFFGAGEPTVEFDLLKEIHKYAIERGGEAVTFEIQTNGAFSDYIANWLKKNINIIWISCDGTPEIQDIHRPFLNPNEGRKTSEVIEKNIRILLGTDSKAFVGVRATITEENIFKQTDMIDYFYNLGIRNIWVDPIFPSVGKVPLTNKNEFDTMMFAKEFLKATEYAYSKKVFYGSILTCNFNDYVNKHCRACLPVPHLTTDGFVSACDMALFGKDKNHMSPLIYGEWDDVNKKIKYNDTQIEYIRTRTTENMQHCEMCSAKEHCGGYCLGEVLNETGNLFGRKKGVCQAICYLDKNLSPQMRKYKYTHP